jgi:hypothetical protein
MKIFLDGGGAWKLSSLLAGTLDSFYDFWELGCEA